MAHPSTTTILADPQLRENARLVESRMAACAAALTIDDLDGLMDRAARDRFTAAMVEIGADSGTIWLADAARTKLVVGFSHSKTDLVGREQALDEGLISLVLATEQGICENAVYRNARHSKRIDAALQFVTCAMIAVPFYLGGSLCGVISAAQLKPDADADDPPGFTATHLARVQQLSATTERLLNFSLLCILLDLHL